MLSPERALAKLQAVMRGPLPGDASEIHMTRRVPADLDSGRDRVLGLGDEHLRAANAAVEAVQSDLRFEHLRRVADQVWHFAMRCWSDRAEDHVQEFITEYARQPFVETCYLPVEHLAVECAFDINGIRLLPVGDSSIPPPPLLTLRSPIGSVACVDIEGTNFERMADRARHQAEHALRLLRIALRGNLGIRHNQIRFVLDTNYSFAQRASGWTERDDAVYALNLNRETIEQALDHPTSNMPADPSTNIEKQADMAVRWMERAWFTGDPLVAVLYLFFALEAMLGEKSNKLKGHELALRQAMLSHVVTGEFSHPSKTFLLYDEVRSAAVHGEVVLDMTWPAARDFDWDVRLTINSFLKLIEREQFVKRSQLVHFLDQHPDRPTLIAWLRQNGGEWVNDLGQERDNSADHPGPPRVT